MTEAPGTGHTVLSPVTELPIAEVPSNSLADTDAAIGRAQEAFASWRAVPPGERARMLRAFAAVVDAHVEELARLEVSNSDTPSGTPAGRPATSATA